MSVYIKHILGNTFYFAFPGVSIPFYRLSEKEFILVDSGYKRNGNELKPYLDDHDIHIPAILHTHMHLDHIGGDEILIPRDDPEIYGSVLEMRQSLELHTRTRSRKGTDDQNSDDATLSSLMAIRDCLIDTMGHDHIDICGARFRIIPAPGHSLRHQIIVTPDEVCCIGDTLMHGNTLARSKAPYTYDLTQDIKTKRSLVKLDYRWYIPSHEDSFPKRDMQNVIDKNLAIYSNVLKNVALLEEAEPSMKVIDATKKLLENIGIHGHTNVTWLTETIKEYFNYYSEYHTDTLPE